MSSREFDPTVVTDVLEPISRELSFSTFVHFRALADLSAELGAGPDNWEAVLEEWDYVPAEFLERYKRGNCVDFALYGKQLLAGAGIESQVIGSKPSSTYTPGQQEYMKYRHTSLYSDMDSRPTMYEAGWKIPTPIPLLPIGDEVDTGFWKFQTQELDSNRLTQLTTSPDGIAWNRRYNLDPIDDAESAAFTKRLLRVPRKIDMITRLDTDVPHFVIGYNPKNDTLTSNIGTLPPVLGVDDFLPRINAEISEAFGYDIKEEIIAGLGILKAFPPEYWIK